MAATCYDCGETGHVARECPNVAYINGTGSDWCGYCDERTRLIDQGDTMRRCTTCHPSRGRQLPQHRRCHSCNNTILMWDNTPCGSHTPLGPRPFVQLAMAIRQADPDRRHQAVIQLIESRHERGEDMDAWWAAQMRREREQLRLPAPQDDDQGTSQDQPARHASQQQGR
jgi:hypothetical protein